MNAKAGGIKIRPQPDLPAFAAVTYDYVSHLLFPQIDLSEKFAKKLAPHTLIVRKTSKPV